MGSLVTQTSFLTVLHDGWVKGAFGSLRWALTHHEGLPLEPSPPPDPRAWGLGCQRVSLGAQMFRPSLTAWEVLSH